MESVEGILERITYYSDKTSYLVGRLKQEDAEAVTFVGYFPALREGEMLCLKGDWKVHPRYGKQLQVKEWEALVPATEKGLERFLASGMIKGIGPHLASLLVKRFKMETLEIIEHTPQKLLEIPGIGAKKAAFIHQSYLKNKEIKNVMLFLQEHNVSPAIAVRLFKHYGPQTVSVLKENPYRTADEVSGMGFLTADKIARKLGVLSNSPQRIRAALLYLLNRAAEDGHVYLPEKELGEKVEALLQGAESPGKINSASPTLAGLIKEQLDDLAASKHIFYRYDDRGERLVYAAHYYHAEEGSAEKLMLLAKSRLFLFSPGEDTLNGEILRSEELKLTGEQIAAVRSAFLNGVTVITGGPGTGKTTTIRTMIRLFKRFGLKTLLAAPTGRAAKRMSETTGMEARTIHRLLEYSHAEGESPSFQRNEKNPLEAGVVIIDEVSMVDLLLFYSLLKAIPAGCRLILVGDVDQLPSVGAGNVLRDVIASGVIPCVRLHTIFRQASESMIIVNAHRINQGKFPVYNSPRKDFFFISEDDPEKVARIIADLCRERLPGFGSFDSVEDIQVLTPMRKTPVGVDRLNRLLQQELNPPSRQKQELNYGNMVFRLGDKVMQIRNNYRKEVFNGDIGRIAFLDASEGELSVSYPDLQGSRNVSYDLTELDELVLAYAVSVHKSQGSEYPVVVMPVVTQHFILLQRNLLYTGITRAKRLAILVGTSKAIGIAIHNTKVKKRYSDLARQLKTRAGAEC